MFENRDENNPSLVNPLDHEADKGLYSRPMPDRHLMLDIETVDVLPTAGIVQIAAVTFNPRTNNNHPIETFNATISVESNKKHGRSVSQDTMDWWEIQSEEAKEAVFGGEPSDLLLALTQFCVWVNKLRPTCTRVWAKDPDFDVVILQDACRQLGLLWPFKFWEGRSCRTAMEMAYPLGTFPTVKVEGSLHDAIVDCKKQVLEVQHAYYVLGC